MPRPHHHPDLITSLSNPRVKELRKLKERKYRELSASHLVEGVRAIEEGLNGQGPLTALLYNESEATLSPMLSTLLQRIDNTDIELLPTTGEVLGGFSSRSNPHQAIGVFKQRWRELESIQANEQEIWIALEAPKDPGNLGTIIRTCEAAGGAGVILVGNACDPYSPEAMRASTGALFGIQLVKTSLDDFIDWAKGQPVELIGTGLIHSEDYRAPAYEKPCVIVMGTERDGITPALFAACNRIVRIPMRGSTDSLNLSVASALMLFEVANRKFTD